MDEQLVFPLKPDFYYLRDGKLSNCRLMAHSLAQIHNMADTWILFLWRTERKVIQDRIPQITLMGLLGIGVSSVFTTTYISDEFKKKERGKIGFFQ